MAKTITTKEVVRFLELGKRKAELQFKLDFLMDSGADEAKTAKLAKELEETVSAMRALEEDFGRADVKVVVPDEEAMAALSQQLSAYRSADLAQAISTRKGDAFAPLEKRGQIIRRNYDNRENIAKLALTLAKIDGETREAIAAGVRKGSVAFPLALKQTDEYHGKRLEMFLRRLGVCQEPPPAEGAPEANGGGEVVIELSNRKVWVSKGASEKLGQIMQSIRELSPRIHLKNAERQIRQFDEEEEKGFASMQGEYLRLLKEQDELLKEFYEEDGITVTVS